MLESDPDLARDIADEGGWGNLDPLIRACATYVHGESESLLTHIFPLLIDSVGSKSARELIQISMEAFNESARRR